MICEKLIYKWQQVQFQYDFLNDKRAPIPADLSRDSRKTKSSQPPKAATMATEVGEHCNGCGKPNHQRKDCTSGHAPKHPEFNKEGKWIGCASYKTVKAWLAANNRSGEHPTLRFNFRADGTPMVLKPKAKSDRPSERDSKSNPADSSSSSRGGSHYQPRDNQRRDRGSVHFNEREDSSSRGGTSQLSTTMTQPSCNCDDTDVDTTYRMCCITVGNSPSFSAATFLTPVPIHRLSIGK